MITFLHSYYQNSCLFLNWQNTNDVNIANALLELLRVVSPDIALVIYFETFTTSFLLPPVVSGLTECHILINKFVLLNLLKENMNRAEGSRQTKKDEKYRILWEYILK